MRFCCLHGRNGTHCDNLGKCNKRQRRRQARRREDKIRAMMGGCQAQSCIIIRPHAVCDAKPVHQPAESAECRPINGRRLRHLAGHIGDPFAEFATPKTSRATIKAGIDPRMGRASAHTGRHDRDVSFGQRVIKISTDPGVLFFLSSTPQTPHDPVQRPDVIRMMGAALDPAAQAKVIPVNFLGFGVVALFRH